MNMNARKNKNINFDNNDDDKTEEQMDDKEDDGDVTDDDESEEEDDEDEPDLMDNSGKCWEFASKIVDEKHLKEWCQNKMGGMIVGKEEKLTRQFHCQIKECQFKEIFLKSCSIVYTRNKHNHAVKSARNSPRRKEEKINPPSSSAIGQNYVDKYGKLWIFHANVGKNISNEIFRTRFGFTELHKNNPTLNLHCQKANPNGGRCPIKGIYLKSNGCLYTRGEHEHSKRGKIPENFDENYVDHLGNIWKFDKEIGKNIERENFLNKYGFGKIATNVSGFYLRCQNVNPTGGKCKFALIYLKSNGCIYTRGEHKHALAEKNPIPNVGDDFVDHVGKTWPFHSKIGKQHIPDEIWRNKFGFRSVQRYKRTFNLYCKKIINGKECQFKGIYVKENGCLYIRGKHEHK